MDMDMDMDMDMGVWIWGMMSSGVRWISVLGPERDAAKRPLRLRGRTGREVNLR